MCACARGFRNRHWWTLYIGARAVLNWNDYDTAIVSSVKMTVILLMWGSRPKGP